MQPGLFQLLSARVGGGEGGLPRITIDLTEPIQTAVEMLSAFCNVAPTMLRVCLLCANSKAQIHLSKEASKTESFGEGPAKESNYWFCRLGWGIPHPLPNMGWGRKCCR